VATARRRAGVANGAALALSLALVLGRSAAVAGPPVTAGSNEFFVNASSMSLAGLSYAGNTTISSGAVASLPVMEFTISGSDAAGFALSTQCAGGVTQTDAAGAGKSATFTGSTTLLLTSFAATAAGGTAFSFTPSSPPPAAWPYSGPYTSVSLTAARITGAALAVPAQTTRAGFC